MLGDLFIELQSYNRVFTVKKLRHADGLFRLILSFTEPLEDMVIAALRVEKELKEVLCKTVSELPVTLDRIKIKAKKDSFMIKMK